MTAATLDLSTRPATTLGVAAGRNLIAAGMIFGLANLTQYGVLSGILHLHPAVLSLTWPVAVGLFIVSINRLKANGGDSAARAARWSRWAIFAQIGAALSLAAASYLFGDWKLMMWMSPVGLGFYSVAWMVAGSRGGRPWMGVVGLASAAAAGGVALLIGTPEQYLAYGTGLFVFAAVPGLFLVSARVR